MDNRRHCDDKLLIHLCDDKLFQIHKNFLWSSEIWILGLLSSRPEPVGLQSALIWLISSCLRVLASCWVQCATVAGRVLYVFWVIRSLPASTWLRTGSWRNQILEDHIILYNSKPKRDSLKMPPTPSALESKMTPRLDMQTRKTWITTRVGAPCYTEFLETRVYMGMRFLFINKITWVRGTGWLFVPSHSRQINFFFLFLGEEVKSCKVI